MTNDKLIGKLVHWMFILQEYEFKVIHRLGITHQNVDTMLRKPLTTSKNFLEAKQDFNHIPAIHVFYAFSYLALLQCNMVTSHCGYMGGLGHFEVSSALGIPSPSYTKSLRSHTTSV